MKLIYALCLGLGLVLGAPHRAAAQHVLEGRVLDAETEESLAGVNILAPGTTLAATTDANGAFCLVSGQPVAALVFSYVGYRTRTVQVDPDSGLLAVRLSPAAVDLQTVIVSASREEESRTAAPMAISILSAAELRASKPNKLYEALNTLPGVHMTDLGNEQHSMSIRQPLSYRALFAYLEDGVPIRPTGVFNHNALIEMNMAAVSRIEVVRGPSSSLYGSNAIGGAVNFITPRPSVQPSGTVNVRTDNHGYRRSDVEASGTLGKLGLYGGGYTARQREGWAEHSDFDKLSLTLRADYAFTPLTQWVTTFSTNRLNTDTNGSLDSLNFYGRGFTSLQTFTYRKVEASRLTSRLEHVWNAANSTDLTMFWRSNAIGQLPHYRIRNNLADPSHARGEENEDSFHSLGLNVQHRVYLPWLDGRLIAGASVDRSPNSYVAHYINILVDPETGRYQQYERQDSLLTDYDVDLLNAAVYTQLEFSPIRRLKLAGSLRYDRIGYGYDNHLPPSAFSGAPDERNDFRRISPRAGLTYDVGGQRGLYANYSQGFLPPEVGELYRGVKVPVLRPATFDSYEAGGWAAFLNGTLYLDASVYRMDGSNEIISVRLDDGSMENRNAGRTRHSGVELGSAFSPSPGLTLRLNGAYARHTFIDFEDQGQPLDGNEMDAAPHWIANAEALYRPPFLPGARLGLGWQHIGPYYMDPANTLRYDGYNLLNARLGYEVKGVEAWLNVQNVTDALYASIASKTRFGHQYTPAAPRSISFGIGYRFGTGQ